MSFSVWRKAFAWPAACVVALLGASTIPEAQAADETARETIVRAILVKSASEKRAIISSLAGREEEEIAELLGAWRADQLFVVETDGGAQIPVRLIGEPDAAGAQSAVRVDNAEPLRDAAGQPRVLRAAELEPVKHNNALRVAMRGVLDIVDLGARDKERRLRAVRNFGLAQDGAKLGPLQKRLEVEKDREVREALEEAIALIQLRDPSAEIKIAALETLARLDSIGAKTAITAVANEAEAAGVEPVREAARRAIRAIDNHLSFVNFVGTLFRGVSTGSILLVVALGLAITFGLMGVINMAHGEMIAIGAYTTYMVQEIFADGITLPFFGLSFSLPGMNLSAGAQQSYFLVALPMSFLVAAGVGLALERSVIRFLYRRPLESLLATWGVSLILQQTFKLMFGANNVNVQKPSYMAASWDVNDVGLGWAWLFIIGFAILTVVGLWLVLNRTSLGLLIRAVMQNRNMAACMGVRSTRVNMLTFALGCGLAGLAGAFVSQVTNVGPALGQSYIIDSFLVVVVGGVGHLGGTVISAYGIGGIDQVLQQYLPSIAPGLAGVPYIGNFLQNLGQDSAVFGKILVLFLIILFLQWRPAGIFVTRSRSLEA